MRMNHFYFVIAIAMALTACGRSSLPGDTPVGPPGAAAGSNNEIERHVFAPELVMAHQAEIALSPEQRESIVKEIDRSQAELNRLQWDMSAEVEKLAKLLEAERSSEADVTAAAGRVMVLENQIKSGHLLLLVRIKNTLTAEQQKKLTELRARG